MIRQYSKYIILVVVAIVLWVLLLPYEQLGTESNTAQVAQREEIQRYFGYEELFYRYLTIPYDVSAQVNQQGRYVDIGFALFALLPLAFLYVIYRRKKYFYLTMAGLMIYLAICFKFSFLMDTSLRPYNPANADQMTAEQLIPFTGRLLGPIYELGGAISAPIITILEERAGQRDHFTYPLIIALFLGIIYFILTRGSMSQRGKVVTLIGVSYAFMWWILGSAIIWYGLLMIPFGYVALGKSLGHASERRPPILSRYYAGLSIGVLVVWAFLSYISRISNVMPGISESHPNYGMQIVEPRTIPYTVGMIGAEESIDILAANLTLALQAINRDSSLVLMCGSPLLFDIKNNSERVFEDNSISYFNGWAEQHKTKAKITEVLKSYGFGFIVLDLRLFTIDRTPEKSLRKKFNILLFGFLKDNPGVRLVATDQIISKAGREVMGVFGDETPVRLGSYAVFEIL